MKTRNGSYPHPVLGNRDDVISSLSVKPVRASFTPSNTEIDLRIESNDPDLFRYLEEGILDLSVWWDCSSTLSSGQIPITKEDYTKLGPSLDFRIALSQEDLRGEVTLTPEFTAGRDIDGFRWTNQHEDYGDTGFNVKKGDFLGLTPNLVFDARKAYDALNPPLGSLFRLVRDKNQKEPITLDYSNSENITIFLSSEMTALMHDLGQLDSVKIATVVLPALMDALSFVSTHPAEEGVGDYADFGWYRSLLKLIDETGIDLDQPLVIAERLLNKATVGAIKSIVEPSEEE